MHTVFSQTTIEPDGKLHLEVPTNLPAGPVDVVVVIQPAAAESVRDDRSENASEGGPSNAPRRRRLPKGAGKYSSDYTDTAQRVDEILSDAVREGQWP